jgi:DNA-binding MarR family transcriptional regulator
LIQPQPSAAERRRTESNVTEQSRALPNKPNKSQRELPIEQVEQSDEAYLAALDSAALPDGVTAIVRWLIQDGRRESGEMRLAVRTQRQIADRVRKSASTVCESLRRLRNSGLVREADGEYRLRLALLVEISEVAQTHREQARREVDPEEAWQALVGSGARPRSACSAALGTTSGSVEERSSTPVSVTSVSVSGSGAASRLPSAAERGERDDCLRDHSAWRQLQTRHFRDAAGKPAIVVAALQPCFYAAVEADLLDNEPEHKIRFLAAAYDLAHQVPRWDAQQRRDVGVRSPAVCLRRRVERGALFRATPEGHAWAKQIVFPGVSREQQAVPDHA